MTLSFVTQWGQTAIYTASAEGHTETVKVLLQAKADTEIQHTVTAFFSRQQECSCWQNNFSLIGKITSILHSVTVALHNNLLLYT